MTRVRLWQVASPAEEVVGDRVERVMAALPAALGDTDLLVLPELWLTGAFNLADAAAHQVGLEAEPLIAMAAAARTAGTWLHAGSFPVTDPQEPAKSHNTSYLFGPDGELVARYRKQRLFGFADGERLLMNRSDDLVVETTCLGRTGLATCYDLRFPELFRALVSRGAETLLLTAGWPTSRIDHWRVLVQARAIECQAFVVACNGRGSHAGVTLGGESMVVGPRGEVVAQAGPADEFLDANIDIAEVARWRDEFPALLDRRIW